MTVLQHYYTSFVNRETGSAGFQVKSMSEGISAEMQAIIPRLIAYRIPANMEERSIERHPVALRYYYHTPQECILLCSQSSGNDENGRPGNFFAHSVVMSPADLAYQAPILYWHSPFWRKQAAETRINPLPEFDVEQSLDIIDEMWTFLANAERKEAFFKLMCAVVQSERSKRRIIIIDTDKNVALWVAAVSCMLPPACRLLLSFSTYHHDPQQSLFLITGTINDGTLRVSLEESVSHFILDGRTNRTSDIEESEYAKLVSACAHPDRYASHMMQFFVWYEQRFPRPTRIDEQLDLFATYVWLRRRKEPVPLKAAKLEAIKVVLSAFEQLSSYDDEDRQELTRLKDLLEHTRQGSRSREVQNACDRVARLYLQHNISTDALFRDDLRYYTKMLLEDLTADEAIESFNRLHQTYDDDLFVRFINESDYLNYVTRTVTYIYNTKLRLVWKHIGPYLRPGPSTREIFLKSINVWEGLLKMRELELARQLFSLIKNAMGKQELAWLRLLVEHSSSLSGGNLTVMRFYWQLVSSLGLDERIAYRAIVRNELPTVVDEEFREDLLKADLQSKMAVINKWVAYTRQTAIKTPSSVVNDGLVHIKDHINKRQWRTLILDVLLNDDLLPLLAQREDSLVQEAFSELALQDFSREHSKLYCRYKDHHFLSETDRNVLAGMVAMIEGHLDAGVSMQLYRYVNGLSSETYYREIYYFISEFLNADIAELDHSLMISALFIGKYQDRFWPAYWGKVHLLLTQLSTNDLERAVHLLAYWFALLPGQMKLVDQKYVVHLFFLTLRQNLNTAQYQPNFSKALDTLEGKASSYAWYPLIQDLFLIRQKNFAEKGQEWMKSMYKRLPGQKVDEQAQEEERKFTADVGTLLTKGTVRERHIQYMPALCREESYEAFWSIYKDRLIQALTSSDVEHILEIFTFWFDEAFLYLGGKPYIAQEFFIKLLSLFESARKEHESNFRKTAERVIKYFEQPAAQRKHDWYPLLHSNFVEGVSARRGR